MSFTIFRGLTAAGLILAASMASAQEDQFSYNQVAAKTAWAVYVEDEPKECWSVSAPEETVNTRDGRVVAARRSEILLFNFYRPGETSGQVTFTGGYPFASGSTVTLEIGETQFDMFTDGEWAWPASGDEDAKIIAALKRGTKATMTGRSGRGTTTKDTFSLLGFTAASEDARKRCGG